MKINLLIKICLILVFLISNLDAAVEKEIVKEIKLDDLVFRFYQNYDKNVKGDYSKQVSLFLEITAPKGEILKAELKDAFYGGAFIYTNLKMVVEKISPDKYYVIFNIIFGGDGDSGHDKTLIFEYDRKDLKAIYDQYLRINEIKNHNNRIRIKGERIFSQCMGCSFYEDTPEEALYKVPLNIEINKKGIEGKVPLNNTEIEKLLTDFTSKYIEGIKGIEKSKNIEDKAEYTKKYKEFISAVEFELRKMLKKEAR